MFQDHQHFLIPEDNRTIWRYMDLVKYISLLSEASLPFPSAKKLTLHDPFEGAYAKYDYQFDPLTISAFQNESEEFKKRLIEQWKQRPTDIKRISQGVYINSWFLDDYDSPAMWRGYAPNRDGIAIKSSVGRLKKSFDGHLEPIYIGVVQYIDYELDTIRSGNFFLPFFHKRKNFEYEHEVRAVCFDKKVFETKELLPEVIKCSVDLDILIEQVYVAPTAPSWIRNLVAVISEKFNLKKPIHKSFIKTSPWWEGI